LKNKSANLIGGNGSRTIPKFHGDGNDPFTTQMEKSARAIHGKDKAMMDAKFERINPPVPPPQPLVSLTLGNNPPPAKVPGVIYPATHAPIPNSNNPIATDYMIPWNHNQANVPIIKKYNISIQGMDGNLTMASQIFEDILPESNMALNRMTTVNERSILHSYIRTILLKRGDGEEIAFDDKKPELINLLSYMKMMEINPYHFSRLSNSAYKTMAPNFIMFRSCYPIRLDRKSNNLSCASDNIGANIRCYSMSVYDELAGLLNENGMLKSLSDPWREIMFYSYIREEILKKKICPHFPFLHTYYITDNTSIDFDKLREIKGTTDIRNEDFIQMNNKIKKSMFKNSMENIITSNDGYNYTVNIPSFKAHKVHATVKVSDKVKKNSRLKNLNTVVINEEELDINSASSKCIVAITEAPDQNIIDWSTRTYVLEEGPVRKQISSGVHSDLTWKSVLFQLLTAFAIMYNKGIAIRDFTWEKNVFIKTFNDSGAIGYWKYRINDVDFYVPNMKALLMIDSCYDQVVDGFVGQFNETFKFKTVGKFCDTPSHMQFRGFNQPLHNDDTESVFRQMFENMFDVNALTTAFKLYGGVQPSPDILLLIGRIYDVNFLDHKRIDIRNSIDARLGKATRDKSDQEALAPDATIRQKIIDLEREITAINDEINTLNNDNNNPVYDLTDIFIREFGMFLHNKLGDIVDNTDMQQLREPGKEVQSCIKGELVAFAAPGPQIVYKWAIVIDPGPQMILLTLTDNKVLDLEQNVAGNQVRRIFGTITQKYKPDHKINSSDELLETYNINI